MTVDQLALEKAIKAQVRRDLGLYPPMWWGRLDQSHQDDLLETAVSEVMETIESGDLWTDTSFAAGRGGGAAGAALRAAVEPWVRDGFEAGADETLVTAALDEALRRIVGWQSWYWMGLATRLNQAAEIHLETYGESIGGVYGIAINGPVVAAGENNG